MKNKLHLLFLFYCSLISAQAWAQGDDCSSATAITVGTSCIFTTYDNSGFNDSGDTPQPTCGFYSAGDAEDVWFSVTVPLSGELTFDSQAGGITDGAMTIYRGTCGSLTQIECDDDDGTGFMPQIVRTGLTPGETIYIRFYEYGGDVTGTFGLCVFDSSPPPPTNDDPCGAIPLALGASRTCSPSTFSTAGTTDSGIADPGCGDYQGGDMWFEVTVPTSGHLIFEMAGAMT